MKNLHKISYLILCFLAVSSCKKSFLDLSDPTKKTADKFYQNEAQIQQAVNGAYSSLQDHVNSQWIFAEMSSDNTTVQLNPSDRGQTDRIEAFEFWNVTATNANIADMYAQSYNALYNINFALSKIGGVAGIADAKKNQYIGELEFMRAYYYFNLVRYFGPVVLITKPLATSSDAFATTRATEDAVYTQIIADLTDAATKLPKKSDYAAADIGRASKGSALGLLGKVYLTKKDFPNAQSTLTQVLSLGYSLVADYNEVFDTNNKNNSESVFEVQYQGGNNLGEWSDFIDVFAPRGSEGAVTGFSTSRPQGWNIPTRNIINEFEPNDKRKAVSLKTGYTNSAGVFVAIPFVNKYNHPHTIDGRTDDDWPVLRYSDVLLMLAEAINEQSGPGNAYQYINQVRTRAGLAALSGLNQDSFRSAIRHERRVELAFENDRWFDLKRALTNEQMTALLNAHGQDEKANPTVDRGGVPFAPSDYKFDGYEALYPIPDRQLFLDHNLKQNPGY
ncbi:RagB/SusD family nutrient uptake outer membrane protein [Mucilaginibacter sp. BJC16-A38]|uniref:RagB/SusD family nutrient uptake outer membrane protein n=1 Tax=Mucilaginibacter phenanthrenivorans TaxID=1234842 RepID=UPI002157968E|nr:RagB/SusD family nutrient uptake outer membrane protein [Mucilaginibacter phenanthrenivorans]MCR8560268.1 RagB/SusD family nutrient uptake outer membrane protein [Mucilaginibacter phenanthrenivorans]